MLAKGTETGDVRPRRAMVDRRLGLGVAVAVAVAAAWAAVAGWWTPRGPISGAEGLVTITVSLLVGGAAGLATRSRWSMLLVPAVFVLVFELVRSRAAGPTVDGLHFSTYGIMAFVVGRGVHGLLALVPMVLGAALGAGLARRLGAEQVRAHGRARVGLYVRRGVAAMAGIGLVLLAVLVARPSDTEPITGGDGKPLAGSVAELARVEVGGHDLAMMIRGRSTDAPVLLFLAGGPGGSELGAMRRHLPALERDFVVATWDQRGTGKSYGELDPVSTLTLRRAVGDTIEVTNYLRDRFGQDKIYLLGNSWGTILGVLAARQHPELYRAFIGTGQMVSPLATDRIFYADTLRWARRTGDTDLVGKLTKSGPPPYASVLDYEAALSYEHEVYPYDHARNSEGEGGFSENLFVHEYTLLEQIHNLGAFMDTFSALYPRIQGVDLRRDVRALEVPVFLVQGRHEAPGRARLAEQWLDLVQAPRKQMIVLDASGHRPLFEQPSRFHDVMTDIVLARTRPDPSAAEPSD